MTRPVPPLFTPRPRFGDQVPPAIFPPVLGALALGLAWRRAAETLAVPGAVADLILGAMTLLFLFCAMAYAVKFARRPGVLPEDLRVLPGRAGLSAMVLSVYLVAAALVPIAPRAALVLLGAGFALHGGLVLLVLRALIAGPPGQRRVTPVWHLQFVGFIVGAVPAQALGLAGFATAILYATGVAALAIWGASLVQFVREDVPAPLRPLLAIHLAPANLLGTVAILTDKTGLAWVCAGLAVLLAALLLVRGPWLLRAGFSPFWGALTFPLATLASFLLAMAAAGQGAGFRIAGGLVLVAATLAIAPILFKVMQAWAKGGLGARTNAARA
ncbi:tellurium resistance protein [Rhodovulum euryhalinum]|uniref:Tellurite resistance protein n=1 Tax=Rhodovulum euryhalinum TaxID=35805 RepID=A0A4V6NPA9_9RHOB|nr:tellurium resistance protein [Rhodovulum euryhalinum]TCO72420.1 tellurite resistance protein [Rhodovulum euryhalinum]